MDNKLFFSSESNEHYTPYDFLIRVCEFYGGNIDLDPCANSLTEPHCPALMHYTIEVDGLVMPWWGNVFVNPPYGRGDSGLAGFVKKCLTEYESGNVNQILLLVPSRTDTQWHKSLGAITRCYITGRLKFVNAANQGNSAPFPSVLFYFGKNKEYFYEYWSSVGEVFIPRVDEPDLGELDSKEQRRAYMREYMRKKRAAQRSKNPDANDNK